MLLELDDALMEPFPLEGMYVPLIRLSLEPEPPSMDVKVGDREYHYERSYPIKGHSAVLPAYIREQMSAGKTPLLIERPNRYYVYLAA